MREKNTNKVYELSNILQVGVQFHDLYSYGYFGRYMSGDTLREFRKGLDWWQVVNVLDWDINGVFNDSTSQGLTGTVTWHTELAVLITTTRNLKVEPLANKNWTKRNRSVVSSNIIDGLTVMMKPNALRAEAYMRTWITGSLKPCTLGRPGGSV